MIKDSIAQAINEQINQELYSAYLYLGLASHYQSANLKGFATWLTGQAQEEIGHAMKFYQFLHDRGGTPVLKAIAEPPTDFPEPHEAFALAYEHEQKITKLIDQLVTLAEKEGDRAFAQFLQWFVGEQVEEESSTKEIVDKLKLSGDTTAGLMVLDQQLGARGTSA